MKSHFSNRLSQIESGFQVSFPIPAVCGKIRLKLGQNRIEKERRNAFQCRIPSAFLICVKHANLSSQIVFSRNKEKYFHSFHQAKEYLLVHNQLKLRTGTEIYSIDEFHSIQIRNQSQMNFTHILSNRFIRIPRISASDFDHSLFEFLLFSSIFSKQTIMGKHK